MIKFLLNNKLIETKASPGMAMLDFIRNKRQLKGAKLVCKEGECGACTVLVGRRNQNNEVEYQSMTSCIMPLVNAGGKHIVTIEGLNMDGGLSPVQNAMVAAYGAQCGFCTPGFVVSLSGYLLANKTLSKVGVLESIDGNICRCTGYKSIERAAYAMVERAYRNLGEEVSLVALADKGYIPAYFKTIAKRLANIAESPKFRKKGIKLGGGTDLYVQKPYAMYEERPSAVFDRPEMRQIRLEKGVCTFGASLTMGDLYRSPVFKKALPDSTYIFKLLSSTPIRNMSTIGGNLVNASPIGDFTILLLGLNSTIILNKKGKRRALALKDFYKGYKKMDLKKGEYLELIQFEVPVEKTRFHFEKVSQRKFLDIASVNFASSIGLDEQNVIRTIHLAVGGVGPVPMYLNRTIAFLKGKKAEQGIIDKAIKVLNTEISPISDSRGSATYKRLLARQLFIAQFIAIDPAIYYFKASEY